MKRMRIEESFFNSMFGRVFEFILFLSAMSAEDFFLNDDVDFGRKAISISK